MGGDGRRCRGEGGGEERGMCVRRWVGGGVGERGLPSKASHIEEQKRYLQDDYNYVRPLVVELLVD